MKYRLKSASGPLTGQTFDLDESTLLGSGEHVDVRLEGLDAEHDGTAGQLVILQ